jgi:hypothetical protein
MTMSTETKPTSMIKKYKYFNHMDEAFGLICMSISPKIFFHVESYSTPNEIWTTLEGLFGKYDDIRGHMFDIELNSLDPIIFYNIQHFLMKFKSLPI